MRKGIKWLIIFFVAMQLTMNAFATNNVSPTANQERIIGIETSYFFNDLPGTFFIYFGRPTCPSCVEFEPYLLEALGNNNQVVYYYNTSYWKNDSQYDRILSKYHVNSVPLLVETVNGEYRDAYQFDPDASADETRIQLDNFFIKRSTLFPVTGVKNFPVQFHSYLFTFTFLIMCSNACYMVLKRNDLAGDVHRSALAWIVVNSTLLLALHIAIAGFGFGFAMQYEASPATGLFAKVGTYTWLTLTPLLYFITLGLAIKIKIKQNIAKRDKSQSEIFVSGKSKNM